MAAKIVKPVTKTIKFGAAGVGSADDIIQKAFGPYGEPFAPEKVPAALDQLSLNEIVALLATLGDYEADIREKIAAAEANIIARNAALFKNEYGDENPNVEVLSPEGVAVGSVVLDTSSSDELNTVTSKTSAEKVKQAIVAANLGSKYIQDQPRLNNSALLADFNSGSLPASVSGLLKVNHKEKRTVSFSPAVRKGGK